MAHAKKSRPQPAAYKTPPGQDSTLDFMRERGLPLTRESYLGLVDLVEPIGVEMEYCLPKEFQRFTE